MGKILILGSRGFIGSNLVAYLKKKGIGAVGADVAVKRDKNTLNCDITRFKSIFSLIKQITPEVIINAAGIFKSATPKEFYDVNTFGSVNLLESVSKIKGYNPKIFFMGTAAEYGMVGAAALPVKESQPLMPVDHYGISKAAQTYYALAYLKKGFNIYIGRPFNALGPGLSDSLAFGSFAKQLADIKAGRREARIYVGSLNKWRDFIDVHDLVDAIWKIIRKGRKGRVYNICGGRAYSINGLLKKMVDVSGINADIVSERSRIKSIDVPVIYGDYGRLHRDTGWSPTLPIEDSIKSMINRDAVK